jgi:uncharacterized peroxidase-related enzyme
MYSLIDPLTAIGFTKDLFDATQQQLGRVPNLYRAMANSPKALAAYLAFRGTLQDGALDRQMCERIALLTAELNICDYCVSAHSFRAAKMGMSAQDIAASRIADSDSPKIRAALVFVQELIDRRGAVTPTTKLAIFEHGWSEAEVGEIVAHVALNVLSNYFKQVAEPTLDFPPAQAVRS